MVKEAYCSFEIAKLLKEKGFNEPCRMYWSVDIDRVEKTLSEYNSCLHDRTNKELELFDGEYNKTRYSAPTHQMALAWLRQEKYIIIFIMPGVDDIGNFAYFYDIATWNEEEGKYEMNHVSNLFYVYEEAVEAALRYSLENLV